MNNTTGVSSGAGSARLSSILEFTLDYQWRSCGLMFRFLRRASFFVPFYLTIILSATYMCVSGIDVAYIWLYVFPIPFETVFLLFLVCHFINIFNNSSVSPGCIVWNNLFSKCKLCKNANIYHVTFKEEFKDIKGVIRIRISKKNIKHTGKKKNIKRTNNDLQNIHMKLKIELCEPDKKPGVFNSCSSS